MQNQFLRALSSSLFEKLRPRLRSTKFRAGEKLFVAGDNISSVYFPECGAVSLVIQMGGGQMIESALIGRDSLVGGGAALVSGEAVYDALVQVGGSMLSLDMDCARRIAHDTQEFRSSIFRHEQLILAQAQQSAACNATHHLGERLARWLLRVRDAIESDTFDLTQESVAEMLGVGRTTVCQAAHTLQEAGLVSYRRGQIKIENADALQEAACECYSTIRGHYMRLHQSQNKLCSV